MKPIHPRLIDALLDETADSDFREAILRDALRSARKRKHLRQSAVIAVTVCVLTVATTLLWRRESSVPIRTARLPDLVVVQSVPLDPSQIVSTRGSVPLVTSSSSKFQVTVVETRVAERFYAELDDQQLLELFSGTPVALVHRGHHRAELIFLNPGDQEDSEVR